VIGPHPLCPVDKPCQNSLTVFPMGVKAPRPVTTTRFNSIIDFLMLSFDQKKMSIRKEKFGRKNLLV
jgi:hypothetical protein